ncbi:MAG TPA: sortase, partial [Terriglobales bacterium]|nr:sortase [Terriglobales bacterium]
KDLVAGDTIEIEAKGETSTYKIDRMVIVEPADISVLAPQDHPSLTLVTCYPFYFVGSAPQRYIVQASRVESSYRQSVDSSSRLQSKQIDAQGTIK